MSGNRIRRVAFIDVKLSRAFAELKSGKFEDKQLAVEIGDAIDKLKENPLLGVRIERRL